MPDRILGMLTVASQDVRREVLFMSPASQPTTDHAAVATHALEVLRKASPVVEELLTPELRFIGPHRPLDFGVGLLASGPGYPVDAAAWGLMATRVVARRLIPTITAIEANGRTDLMIRIVGEFENVEIGAFEKIIRNAVHTLRSYRRNMAEARLPWRVREDGTIALEDTLAWLSIALGSLSSSLRSAGHNGRAGDGAEDWLSISESVSMIRQLICFVRDALPQAAGLPEQQVSLEGRWKVRLAGLLEQAERPVGPFVDIPAIGGQPAVIGGRYWPTSSHDELCAEILATSNGIELLRVALVQHAPDRDAAVSGVRMLTVTQAHIVSNIPTYEISRMATSGRLRSNGKSGEARRIDLESLADLALARHAAKTVKGLRKRLG